MNKIKYLAGKLKEHHEELGGNFFETSKWLVKAVRFRILARRSWALASNEGNLKDNLTETMIEKKSPDIFIFATVPFYDIGGGQRSAQLAKTFNILGYRVHYIFGAHANESKIFAMEVPTLTHKYIDDYSLDEFNKNITKDSVVILEAPNSKFCPYVQIAKKRKAKIVYENIDNWETSLGTSIFDEQSLFTILKLSDALVGTAKPLIKQLRNYSKKIGIKTDIHYIPNAVNDTLFDVYKEYQKPNDFISGEKTLIYYGSLWGEWFDWDLIYGIAKKFPSYSILLIGEKENIPEKVKNAPENVHFLGIKSQSELPAYLAFSDVALLPFKVDKIGEYVSPLKIFEYIAMGKMVLSTKLPEVIGYPNTYVGDSLQEWVKCLKNIQKEKIDLDSSAKFIEKNNWYDRCVKILQAINMPEKTDLSKFKNNLDIIILNYNNYNCIFRCLDSVLEYSKRYKYHIVVVDNGSKDGSYEKLKKEYADTHKIQLLRNNKNGCSSGRNLGIKNSKADYVLFLDSDQFAKHPFWLDIFFDLYSTNKKIGAIGWGAGWVRRKKYDSAPTVDCYPYKFMPANVIARSDIDYLATDGMLVSRATLNKVGMFDEIYDPTCYEDTDLSFAIRNINKDLLYCPYLGIYHLPHQTTHGGGVDHDLLIEKHADIFEEKWKKINPNLFK